MEAAVKKHKNEIYLRGVMTMNMTYVEVLYAYICIYLPHLYEVLICVMCCLYV